jgi:hypothetical protein
MQCDAGTCHRCGEPPRDPAAPERCCFVGTPCRGVSNACIRGFCQDACGEAGEPCCPGGMCMLGILCPMTTGMCFRMPPA